MNDVLLGIARKIMASSKVSPEGLHHIQNEWRTWYDDCGIEITDDSVDAMVATMVGVGKYMTDTFLDVKGGGRKNPVLLAAAEGLLVSTAALIKLRPTAPWRRDGEGSNGDGERS